MQRVYAMRVCNARVLGYGYNYGDDWEHDIEASRIRLGSDI